MSADALALRLDLGLCVAVLVIGAVIALTSANVIKRIIGLLIAYLAVLLGLAALRSDGALLLAALTAAAASLVLGLAIAVRLQELYGGVEAPELDAADAESEPAGPSA